MNTITIYGPGCPTCKQVERLVQRVVAAHHHTATITKVSDYQAMAQAGILSTPTVAVNGTVMSRGRIPTEQEVVQWLTDATAVQ